MDINVDDRSGINVDPEIILQRFQEYGKHLVEVDVTFDFYSSGKLYFAIERKKGVSFSIRKRLAFKNWLKNDIQ
jgi:hypothetical protein